MSFDRIISNVTHMCGPFRAAVSVGCALTFVGCASLIPVRDAAVPTVSVPLAWSASPTTDQDRTGGAPAHAAVSLSADWWQRFNDMQLTALVSQALDANTDVRSAQAGLRQARALRDQAASRLQPTLNVSASAQRAKSAGMSTANTYDAGFDASWEPDIFGGTRAALAAARADIEVSAATLAHTRVSIAAEVAVAYMQLRGYQARLAIARESLGRQEETLQLTQWRAQAGLTTSRDVEQARASTEQTRAQIPSLQTSIAQTEHSLAVLTSQAPGALRDRLDQASAVPSAPDDLALSIPAETLRQRPDVRAAEEKVLAAAARVTQADAARYPSFKLSGEIGLSALSLGSLTGSGALVSALLGSISMPIFDGGATRAALDAQQAAFEQTRVGYQATVLGALRDVEDALVALAGARDRVVALRQAAEAARNAALLADNQYAGGLIDFQTVLDTQRTLLTVQDSVASTEVDLSTDHVRLYKSLGGGWRSQSERSDADTGSTTAQSVGTATPQTARRDDPSS